MLLLLWCCLRHSVPTIWLRLPLLSVLLARIDADEDDATLVCSHLVPRHHVVPSFYLYSPFPFCHLVYEKKKDEEEEEHCCPSLLGCSLIAFISQSTRLLWSSNSFLLRDSLASLAASAGLLFIYIPTASIQCTEREWAQDISQYVICCSCCCAQCAVFDDRSSIYERWIKYQIEFKTSSCLSTGWNVTQKINKLMDVGWLRPTKQESILKSFECGVICRSSRRSFSSLRNREI